MAATSSTGYGGATRGSRKRNKSTNTVKRLNAVKLNKGRSSRLNAGRLPTSSNELWPSSLFLSFLVWRVPGFGCVWALARRVRQCGARVARRRDIGDGRTAVRRRVAHHPRCATHRSGPDYGPGGEPEIPSKNYPQSSQSWYRGSQESVRQRRSCALGWYRPSVGQWCPRNLDSSVRDHGVILFIQFSSVASWHCDKSATTCKCKL